MDDLCDDFDDSSSEETEMNGHVEAVNQLVGFELLIKYGRVRRASTKRDRICKCISTARRDSNACRWTRPDLYLRHI